MEALLFMVVVGAIIYLISTRYNHEYAKNQYEEGKERVISNAERQREARILRTTPVYAKLISAPETRYTGYGKRKAVKRAIIGEVLFGTPGAFLGSMTTPENDLTTVTEATFLVRYKDGHTGQERVNIKGGRCRELLAVLDEAQADELLSRFGSSSLPF